MTFWDLKAQTASLDQTSENQVFSLEPCLNLSPFQNSSLGLL